MSYEQQKLPLMRTNNALYPLFQFGIGLFSATFLSKTLFKLKLPNPKLMLQQLQVCGRHIIVSPTLSTLYSLLARYEVLRLTEAYTSKRAYGSFNEQ